MIWRTKVQAKVKGNKGPTQGFNLLQNESKLVPRKLDPGPLSKGEGGAYYMCTLTSKSHVLISHFPNWLA
jgi:hypothetical protein